MATHRRDSRTNLGLGLVAAGLLVALLAGIIAGGGGASLMLLLLIASGVVFTGAALVHSSGSHMVAALAEETEALTQAVSQMEALVRAGNEIALARPLGEVLAEMYQVGSRILRNERCAIFSTNQELTLLFRRDVSVELCRQLKESYKTRKGLFVAPRMELLPIENCMKDRRMDPVKPLLEAEGHRALLFIPLVYEKLIVGFMFLFYERPRMFSVEELSLTGAFGSQSAIAIRNGQLRQELDDAVREYRSMFENASDMIATISADGECLTINRRGEEITGRKTQQWMGRRFVEFIHKEDRGRFDDRMRGAFAGRGQRFEARLDTEGKIAYLSITAVPLYHESEVSSIVLFARDLTEERKLNEQLVQAQRMESLGTLAGGIAHDFNNILSSILGHASLLKTKIKGDQAHVHHIELIEKSARRAGSLTSQLLGFARRGRIRIEPIDLNQVVRETFALLERGIEKTIEMRLELTDGLPAVMGDATQIQQVFMNLVLNARDAMKGSGTIWIKTLTAILDETRAQTLGMKSGQCVVVGIRDTGPGIKPDLAARIFEPFFTTKEVGKGTGLGLAMVYGIMKNHGGAVQLASQPGHGATFTLYFVPAPVVAATKEKAAAGPVAAAASVAAGEQATGGTILVVDDEQTVIEVVRETLETAGFKVLTAPDGEEGLLLFDKHRAEICLVILDLMMPRMGGRVAFFKLRELAPEIPVLIVSGYGMEDDIQAVMDAGVEGYVQKPFVLSELLAHVKEILAQKRSPAQVESAPAENAEAPPTE